MCCFVFFLSKYLISKTYFRSVFNVCVCSDAGTNLKVGEPVRRKSGDTDAARNAEEFFLVVPLHLFGSKSRPTSYN